MLITFNSNLQDHKTYMILSENYYKTLIMGRAINISIFCTKNKFAWPLDKVQRGAWRIGSLDYINFEGAKL